MMGTLANASEQDQMNDERAGQQAKAKKKKKQKGSRFGKSQNGTEANSSFQYNLDISQVQDWGLCDEDRGWCENQTESHG